jgi:hypothetical protein
MGKNYLTGISKKMGRVCFLGLLAQKPDPQKKFNLTVMI